MNKRSKDINQIGISPGKSNLPAKGMDILIKTSKSTIIFPALIYSFINLTAANLKPGSIHEDDDILQKQEVHSSIGVQIFLDVSRFFAASGFGESKSKNLVHFQNTDNTLTKSERVMLLLTAADIDLKNDNILRAWKNCIKAEKISSTSIKVLLYRFLTLNRLDKSDESFHLYRKYRSADPGGKHIETIPPITRSILCYSIGAVYHDYYGEVLLAMKYLKKSHKLNPSAAQPCKELMEIYAETGRIGECRVWAEKWYKRNPPPPMNAEDYSDYAVAEFALGNRKKALQWLDKAQKTNPKNPHVYINRFIVFSYMGKTEEAEASYLKGMEMASKRDKKIIRKVRRIFDFGIEGGFDE